MYKGATNFSPHKTADNTNKNQICSTECINYCLEDDFDVLRWENLLGLSGKLKIFIIFAG